MAYFATPYTIHFDDTMAYGSHHFLTGFKFQCEARESLLYGHLIFDQPGAREALDAIHLFTADAYSRNLSPTFLGDRLAILITLEDWGRVSTRFCYRVIGQNGQPICAGFQNLIVADAKTGNPVPLPAALRTAFDRWRNITEQESEEGLFRERVLKSTDATLKLFTEEVRETALKYLDDRYPQPQILEPVEVSGKPLAASESTAVQSYVRTTDPSLPVRSNTIDASAADESTPNPLIVDDEPEVWMFPGQGMFDAQFLGDLLERAARDAELQGQIARSKELTAELIGGNVKGLFSRSAESCKAAVAGTPGLSQVAIHLQSVLSARIRQKHKQPQALVGHSFGELAALSVAGCYELSDGVRAVCERVRAIDSNAPKDGRLLVAMSNRQVIAEEIALLNCPSVVIAGRNHEQQTVISGRQEELSRMVSCLRAIGVQCTMISSPTCFHNPLLREAASAWFKQLTAIPMRPPKTTVYTPIGRRMIAAEDDLPTVLSSQFVRKFDLQGAIDDMVAAGFNRFVDCGSSGSFTRLVKAAGPESIEVVPALDIPATESDLVVASKSLESVPVPGVQAVRETAPKSAAQSEESLGGVARPGIAIVAQGCLLPGGATSPEELYAAITQGRSGIYDKRDLDEHWESDFYSPELTPDRSNSGLVGLVTDSDIRCPEGVDAAVFEEFSRAQRLLCIALAPCISLFNDSQRILCFVGTTADGFQDQDCYAVLRYAGIDDRNPEINNSIGRHRSALQDPHAAVKEVFDRVVRPGLDLTLVDAACASSLYAVALGMQALENLEADLVLAGGLFCPGPGNNCLFSQFNGLTATGCRPFDAGADGVVFSEGSAVVALQREADARSTGRDIVAIVRGAGLSSDGRSPSANVPQIPGQMHAVRRCYENYDIDPATISAIEAHGTSTPVGDSTEIRTLSQFFADHVSSPLSVHSLKGLLGHTGWAAGTASMIAATQAIRTRTFPAQATFLQSSEALRQANGVLKVANQPTRLDGHPRIAVDGFGFGGSNAHVVVEAPDRNAAEVKPTVMANDNPAQDELVVVGWHRMQPTVSDDSSGSAVLRFDREAVRLPDGMILLPDLADDLDVSQSLALGVVGNTLKNIRGVNDDLKRQTGIVLAFGGKTERAVEATTRILSPRLSRAFDGHPEYRQLTMAVESARPSGPYTLQCMMPNVAAGRAALQFNLNGPNFVVDAGVNSLNAALKSAASLLRNGEQSGTKLAIIAAIDANRWPVPGSESDNGSDEYAAAFALTTRRCADEFGMKVLCVADQVSDCLESLTNANTLVKLDACLATIEGRAVSNPTVVPRSETPVAVASESEAPRPRKRSSRNEFPIHAPVWIESPLAARRVNDASRMEKLVVLVRDDGRLVRELLERLPHHANRHLIVVVGENAEAVSRSVADPLVTPVNLQSEDAAHSTLNWIEEFSPTTICAVDWPASWELEQSLVAAASNSLCEMLFLTIKRLADRVASNQTDVWAVFPGGWNSNNEVIHPVTGAVSGLLKSTRREMPDGRFGVLVNGNGSLHDALSGLNYERGVQNPNDVDIVHDGIRRLVRRLRAVEDGAISTLEPSPPIRLNSDSVVLATGAARGVTAIMAEALLRDFGCTVIALGRSPLEQGPDDFDSARAEREFYERYLAENPGVSPAKMRKQYVSTQARWEANATIKKLGETNGKIRYLTVDVSRQDDVHRILNDVAREFGRVDLLIHGAGVQWSKKIVDRTLDEFRTTFNVKVLGLNHLVGGIRQRFGKTPATHILTSAYSIFGNDGQHDYGAANETMDRLCGLTRMEDNSTPVWTSIAWSAWNAIGMTRGTEYKALAEKRNLALLNPDDGQRVFRAVMTGRTHNRINVPLSISERTRYVVRTIPAASVAGKSQRIELPVRLNELACLPYHKARGAMTLPGAWIVDFMARAALRLFGRPASFVRVEGMEFLRFIKLVDGHDSNVRVVVEGNADQFRAWLIADKLNPDGITLETDVVFATAKVVPMFESHLSAPCLNGAIMNGHGEIRQVADPYCAGDPSVDLSGPFDCLPEIEIGPLGRRAQFLPHQSADWGGTVPSLLLDASLRVAGMHVVADSLHVPIRMEKVVLPTGITTDSYSARGWKIRTADPKQMGDDIRCDRVEVTDHQGDLRLIVEGAVVTRLRV